MTPYQQSYLLFLQARRDFPHLNHLGTEPEGGSEEERRWVEREFGRSGKVWPTAGPRSMKMPETPGEFIAFMEAQLKAQRLVAATMFGEMEV